MKFKQHHLSIAIFDSGVGGLSVYRQIRQSIPEESLIYYADVKNAPYGSKSPEQVTKLVLQSARQIEQYGIKALVIACNTATSVAVSTLRETFDFPIIGMEPAIKPAMLHHSADTIVVMGTDLTLREQKFESLVESLGGSGLISTLSMNGLVDLAESFDFNSPAVYNYLEERFGAIDKSRVEAIVLGCTHFVYFKKAISAVMKKKVSFYDGVDGTVNELKRKMKSVNPPSVAAYKLILSGLESDVELIQPYLNALNGSNFFSPDKQDL